MSEERGMLALISERIRSIRNEKGITLKELSKMTGLSVSFLSQVERGTSSLAIPSLEKILEALEVSITDLFSGTQRHQYVKRQSERKEIHSESTLSTLVPLAGDFPGRKLEPMIVILNPKQDDKKEYKHPGEEFYFVIEGEVIFNIMGEEYHLKEGDTIHFPSEVIHKWRNPLPLHTKLMCVITPVIF